MSKKKPSEKPTAKKKAALVPQPHGGALLPGAGGGPQPGSGRPPDEFKAAMRELASNAEMLKHVRRVLNDPAHPQWLGAWKWATERGYGKEVQAVDVNVAGEIVLDLRVPKGEDES